MNVCLTWEQINDGGLHIFITDREKFLLTRLAVRCGRLAQDTDVTYQALHIKVRGTTERTTHLWSTPSTTSDTCPASRSATASSTLATLLGLSDWRNLANAIIEELPGENHTVAESRHRECGEVRDVSASPQSTRQADPQSGTGTLYRQSEVTTARSDPTGDQPAKVTTEDGEEPDGQ